MMLFKNDIKHAAGALQFSGWQDAGVEAVVRAIHDIFPKENTEAVLLIDAENAFNSMVILHNTKLLCPLISTYICNCYGTPAMLFIFGGSEILSKQGTTRGDPTSKGPYALGILQMLHFFLDFFLTNKLQTKEFPSADDLTVPGKSSDIKNLLDKLATTGPKYRYFPKATKSYLTVKKIT